eukprot:3117263-Pyramimonas_sp.AAC.1
MPQQGAVGCVSCTSSVIDVKQTSAALIVYHVIYCTLHLAIYWDLFSSKLSVHVTLIAFDCVVAIVCCCRYVHCKYPTVLVV